MLVPTDCSKWLKFENSLTDDGSWSADVTLVTRSPVASSHWSASQAVVKHVVLDEPPWKTPSTDYRRTRQTKYDNSQVSGGVPHVPAKINIHWSSSKVPTPFSSRNNVPLLSFSHCHTRVIFEEFIAFSPERVNIPTVHIGSNVLTRCLLMVVGSKLIQGGIR